MPLTKGGPHSLVSSPRGGGSTFTTVAPMSPSIIVQNGPGENHERSRTKMSSRGITPRIIERKFRPLGVLSRWTNRGSPGAAHDLDAFEVMRRLLHFPGDRERVDEGVDAEVGFPAVTPRRQVVGRHHARKNAPCRVHRALDDFAFPALAEPFDHRPLQELGPLFEVVQLKCRSWGHRPKGNSVHGGAGVCPGTGSEVVQLVAFLDNGRA